MYIIWFFIQTFQTTYLENLGGYIAYIPVLIYHHKSGWVFFIALHHVTNRFLFHVWPKSGSNGLTKLLQTEPIFGGGC